MKTPNDKPRLIPDFAVVGALHVDQPDWATKGVQPNTARPVVYATASSTIEDLESDRMSEKALNQMAERFVGITAFLNHQYKWPEDVFGTILRTHLVERDEVIDLDVEIAVEDKNPRAMQSYAMIKNGTRAGVSVGVLVLDHTTTDDKHMGRKVIEITDVLPLEASLVGIPAVPRAWVQEAVKSLVERGALKLSCDEMGCRPWLTAAVDDATTKLWEETDNEIRYRVRDPNDFQTDSFKRITLQKDDPKVYAIIGKLTGETTTTIQALRFPNDDWTLTEAKKWVKDHADSLKSVSAESKESTPMTTIEKLEALAALDDEALAGLATLAALETLVNIAGLADLDEEALAGLTVLSNLETLVNLEALTALGEEALAGLARLAAQVPSDGTCACGEHTPGYHFALRMLNSLATELAEAEFQTKFWRLNYAFCDAVWDVIEHNTGDPRMTGVRSVMAEYNNLLIGLISGLPETIDQDDGVTEARYAMAQQMLQDVTCLLAAAGDGAPVDKDAHASDTGAEAITKKIVDLTSRAAALDKELVAQKGRGDLLELAWDASQKLIGEILDLPLEIKTQSGDSVKDAARDAAKRRYPELSPVVESLVRS